MRRVVITGMGAITPVGLNVEDFWNSVKEGKTNFAEVTRFDTTDYRSHMAAEINNFNAKDFMDFKSARRMELIVCLFYYTVSAKKVAEIHTHTDCIVTYIIIYEKYFFSCPACTKSKKIDLLRSFFSQACSHGIHGTSGGINVIYNEDSFFSDSPGNQKSRFQIFPSLDCIQFLLRWCFVYFMYQIRICGDL